MILSFGFPFAVRSKPELLLISGIIGALDLPHISPLGYGSVTLTIPPWLGSLESQVPGRSFIVLCWLYTKNTHPRSHHHHIPSSAFQSTNEQDITFQLYQKRELPTTSGNSALKIGCHCLFQTKIITRINEPFFRSIMPSGFNRMIILKAGLSLSLIHALSLV